MPTDDDGLGALTAALAKAQSEFPTIARDKQVTVQTNKGGSYTFKYAPLDTILAGVRGPLSKNGLAIAQLLDDDDLVTMLLHEGGGRLAGRMALPRTDGATIQALGSAITYLRRYAIQAMLGIAAEEDDDANGSAGNIVHETRRPPAAHRPPPDRPPLTRETGHDGLVGKFAVAGTQDANLRETPDGFVLPFRVKESNRAGQIVLAHDDIAEALFAIRDTVIGQTVTVWGRYEDVESPPKADGFVVTYKVLHLARIKTPDVIIPPDAEATPEPLFPEDLSAYA